MLAKPDRIMFFLLYFLIFSISLFYKRNWHPDPGKVVILRHYSAGFSGSSSQQVVPLVAEVAELSGRPSACGVGRQPALALSRVLHFPLALSFLGGSDGKESACNAGDQGSIPGSARSPGGGPGNPFECSCLENPMDGGAWWLRS